MKKHRVAVVGCGMMAQGTHLPNCRDNPRIELVAVCDINPDTAESCRRKYGAKRAETDWHRIVEAQDLDLCLLATHTNLRGEFIVPALEAGKSVYTEKPLASSVPEMIEIIRATRRTGKSVCVGHNRRSSPAILEFKRLVDKALETRGTPPSVDRSNGHLRVPEERQMQLLIRVNDDARSWKDWVFHDAEGIIFAEMVHFIDIALWMNRGRPVRVFAEGSPRGNFTLIIRFNDGSAVTLHHSMVGHFDYPKELMEATVNNITVAMDQHIEVRQSGMDDEPTIRVFPYAPGTGWARLRGMTGYMKELERERERARQAGRAPRGLPVQKGHAAHLDRFLTHIEGKGPNPCDIEGAVPVTRIALKLLQSARLGLPLAVNPEDWHVPD